MVKCKHGGKGCMHGSVVHGLAGAGGGGPSHFTCHRVLQVKMQLEVWTWLYIWVTGRRR